MLAVLSILRLLLIIRNIWEMEILVMRKPDFIDWLD